MCWGCAQISAPTGGPKDETPPQLLRVLPPNESTNLYPTTLQLEFDEFIVLKNAAKQLLISPPISSSPKMRVKGKSVFLEFAPGSFSADQTYVVAFGGAVVDLHESNPAENLTWAFATGDEIDSLQICGKVVDRMTGAGVNGLRVMLYRDSIPWDSVMNGCRPDALSETNEQGEFTVGHLPDGMFRGLAIADGDGNYQWTPGEYIAFQSQGIASGASLVQDWLGVNTIPERGRPYIEFAQIDSGGFSSVFAANRDDLVEAWTILNGTRPIEVDWIREQDSVFCWMPGHDFDVSGLDSVRIVWSIGAESDTSRFRLNPSPSANRLHKIQPQWPSVDVAQSNRMFRTNRPIQILNSKEFLLTQDSLPIEFEIISPASDEPARGFGIRYEEEDGRHYALQVFPGALENLDEVLRDTLYWNWSTHPNSHLGEFAVKLESMPGPGWFCLSPKSNPQEIQRVFCQNDTVLWFSRVLPGTYNLGFEWDKNEDGIWQFSNPNGSVEPEPYFCAAKPAEIRSNWVFEWTWTLTNEAE